MTLEKYEICYYQAYMTLLKNLVLLYVGQFFCGIRIINFVPRISIGPSGHGRIGGHYFHTWCPYVTKTNKRATTLTSIWPVNKTTDVLRENNENLLAVAWWVILNSPDLF